MSEIKETVEDIVCDMRSYDSGEIADVWVHRFADRIESSWRREKEELLECLKNTMVEMCNYCRSTPEANGLPCLNGCATMLAAKRLMEVAEGGES